MPYKGNIYRILVASPSDCTKERTAIPEIVYAWNSVHSYHTNIILEPVLWETHVTPELGDHPQNIINKQIVDSCDFLIGAFWTRLGTKTDTHASGTAEEIDRFIKKGKRVLLYFSSAPVIPDSIDSEQYKKLIKFKESMQTQGVTSDYSDIGKFRELLQRHLASLMAGLDQSTPHHDSTSESSTRDSEIEMFKAQLETFIRKFEAEWSAERDSEPNDIEDAKYIISSALDDLIHFRSQIASDPENSLVPAFTNVTKEMKILGRHQLFMDGGKSFSNFWDKGDAILKEVRKIPEIFTNRLSDEST